MLTSKNKFERKNTVDTLKQISDKELAQYDNFYNLKNLIYNIAKSDDSTEVKAVTIVLLF